MGLTGGKGGGKSALAAKPNLLSALRIQTSSYGQVVPIVYGQNRIASRLLWSGDFQAIPHTSTTKVGGKGLGSGGDNAISNTTYTYQTAVAMALCMGPIQNIHNVWDTKGRLTLLTTTQTFTVPSGGGGITIQPPGSGVFHSHRGVSRADLYSVTNRDLGSDGFATLSGTQATPMQQVSGTPGLGQFTQAGSIFTFANADSNKVMTITYVYSVPDSNSNGQPQQKLSLTLFPGSRPQTAWSYLTSAHPGQDLGYNGIAYVAASAMDLGESGTLPNLSFEVLGIAPFGAGIPDANPRDVIFDLLSNPFYGMGTGGFRVQTSGGSTQFKLALDIALSSSSSTYTTTVTVKNQGATPCQISDNLHVSPAIQPGTTVNISLTSTGDNVSRLQFVLYAINISDSLDVVLYSPGTVNTAAPTVNLFPVANRNFQNWSQGTGAAVTITPEPSIPLGDFTAYSNFCVANGIFLSPMLDAQKTAATWIQEILDITNAAAVWSEGVLKIIPYGDTMAVGNGATFLPVPAAIYDLTTSDLLSQVIVKRPSVAEVMNSVSVEWSNRANDYNVDVAEDKDDAMIALYGLRKAQPVQAHSITTATVAKFVANLLRKRSVEIRATYSFSLGWQFNLLEPMDLVTLTVPELGYDHKVVRITAMREDANGNIQVDAEDFPWGTAAPTLYPHQPGAGFVAQANADPGLVTAPIIFEANDRISLTGNYEVWIGVCGPVHTNLLIKSQQFDDVAWTKDGGSTVTANIAADPLGGTTADILTQGSGTFSDFATLYEKQPGDATQSPLTFSVWLRVAKGGPALVAINVGDYNLHSVSSLVQVTTAWQRFSVTCQPGAMSNTGNIAGGIITQNTQTAGFQVQVWGAQLEAASSPTAYITTTTTPLTLAVPDWGGCSVWMSPDNVTYVQIGKMYGPSRMGVLTAQLVASADPDTTHTLAVDLTHSAGVLNSASQSDCDNFRTLCYVDGELISYEDATLTGPFRYDLGAHGSAASITGASNTGPINITVANHGLSSGETVVIAGVGGNTAANGTWVITVVDLNNFTLNGSTGSGAYTSGGTGVVAARLRRGVFGSPNVTHSIGAPFLRLDSGVFVWEADPMLVGANIFFKFTSFNRLGLMEQSLAKATAYSFPFNGIFGNHDETPANNATIDSVFTSGTAVNIRVYGPGGAGTAYSAWKMKDQNLRTIPGQTLTVVEVLGGSPQVTTNYWISYDFNAGIHRVWINYNDYVQAIYRGQMRVGIVTTVTASGTGGTTGGLGISPDGGSGDPSRPLPRM